MTKQDKSFQADAGLENALDLLRQPTAQQQPLPKSLAAQGIGEEAALSLLAPYVFGEASYLDSPTACAHMDPPTPWITWATSLWNARLNQNLLHPATAPFARQAEELVMAWLAPLFGMQGGHMCSGSTLANLTALWAARDAGQVEQIIASTSAHISIAKAANILGLPYKQVATNAMGQIDTAKVSELGDISNACLVLTAGTTATGVIDNLALVGKAKWTHIDAAWAGPLCLSDKYAGLLAGMDQANSVAVSAHKWLFQPKDSALVMFRQLELANSAISFGGGCLAAPNIGVQGSRGAAAISLLATLLAWGKGGLAQRIEQTMSISHTLAEALQQEENIVLLTMPTTGVTVFRPTNISTEQLYQRLPAGMLSTCIVEGEHCFRSVAANPMADMDKIIDAIRKALP